MLSIEVTLKKAFAVNSRISGPPTSFKPPQAVWIGTKLPNYKGERKKKQEQLVREGEREGEIAKRSRIQLHPIRVTVARMCHLCGGRKLT